MAAAEGAQAAVMGAASATIAMAEDVAEMIPDIEMVSKARAKHTFVSLFLGTLFGNFVMLNLFVAVILDNFSHTVNSENVSVTKKNLFSAKKNLFLFKNKENSENFVARVLVGPTSSKLCRKRVPVGPKSRKGFPPRFKILK